MAIGREKKQSMENIPCRCHLREGPVWMEDPAKATAMHRIKAALKEDSASCYICVARAAALNRIKAAGGNSVKAAEDSESRVHDEICVMKRVALAQTTNAAAEEGEARPVGVMKKTIKVRDSYFRRPLTGAPLTPVRPLSEDYFQRNPSSRESALSSALEILSRIDEMDNILFQFFEKGYAMMELQVDYGH